MTSQPPRVRRAAVVFIFVTVVLDMLAFGIVIPVLPHLVQQMIGGDIATAARWTGVFGVVYNLMQLLFAPVLGGLSDRFGRRPVILLSNLGLALDFVLMALAQTLPLLFLGRVLSGMTAASLSTANAYIADVTPPERRAAAFGLLGAAFGIGFVIGPALGGLLGQFDLRWPFWFAAALAGLNFLYGWFVLPESLPPERRSQRFDFKGSNPLGAFALLRRHPTVFALAIVVFLANLAHYALNSTFVLFTDFRFGWGPQQVGLSLALVGICSGLVQAVLVRRAVPRFGERRVMLAGLLFGVAGFCVLGLATLPALFLFGIPLLALWGLAGPPTQAIMTRQVAADQQGRLQGAITSLTSFAGIFAPLLFTQVFAASISAGNAWHVPGAAFLLAAVLLAIGFAVGIRATRGIDSMTPPEKPVVGSAAVR